jgi:uncharacterized membrane protein
MRLPLLILHIVAGTVGLLAGTFAMSVRKGGRLHRASGNIFTVAMLTLASSALCLAIMKSQHGNIIGSIITFYMITTAWLAGRRRGIGRLDLAALLVGTGGAVAIITLGVWTLHHPDKNAPAGCPILAKLGWGVFRRPNRSTSIRSDVVTSTTLHSAGPAKRMRFPSGSITTNVLAPHGSFLSV